MESTSYILLLSCVGLSCYYLMICRRRCSNLPPGPNPFPIIGNIHQIFGSEPHKYLAKLSKTHGPFMYLKLGGNDTVVVSSPDVAKKILKDHDLSFPGRIVNAATKAHNHHAASVACLPTGSSQWRTLRRICKEQMFLTQRLDDSRDLRRAKMQELIGYVWEHCQNGGVVDIGKAAFVTTLNFISNTLFSIDFADYNEGSSLELKGIIHGLMEAFGSFNVADGFGVLEACDPQGIKRRAEYCMGILFEKFDEIIDERERSRERRCDMLDVLINGEDQPELSRNDIKHLLLDLFIAGTDNSSNTVEWVMTELVRNPHILSEAKTELQTVIGKNQVLIEESDISRLPYLQAVIKETFRYHPPGPFLVRRKDENDIDIGGYIIPKKAVVMVNIWAMGRDSRIWRDPDTFDPRRFLGGSEIDVKEQNFELIPFGAGRRMCPGLPLAYRMVHMMVASLIHNFDWKPENGMRPEEIDVSEKFGLSLQKHSALKLVPVRLATV